MSLKEEMHGWAQALFPFCRSLTGNGVRETLAFIKQTLPELEVTEVPTGHQAFDWTVPDEWNIRDAYVLNESGERVIDFRRSNLHVVGYSKPVDVELTREELDAHLHSLPSQPDAIPYVTSYYKRRWGFCLSQHDRDRLPSGRYRAVIDSRLEPGSLTFGEAVIPGETEEEVVVSTYVCHPSMANNELSGPVVTTALGRWLKSLQSRRFTYRLVFTPETLGTIVFLSRRLEHLRSHCVAGFVATCIGDEGGFSMVESRTADTLADRVGRHVVRRLAPDNHTIYDFLVRASDERQYCSVGVDLPFISLMRTKYGEFPEYHTSLDDLSLVTPSGLEGGLTMLQAAVSALEANRRYRAVFPCEPQLGKRGLYPSLSMKGSAHSVRNLRNVLAFADGKMDLLAIADRIGVPIAECADLARKLEAAGTLEEVG